MSLRDYVVLGKLGEGSFGIVQKVIHIESNQQYALKTVNYSQLKQRAKANAFNEIQLLSQLSHQNIIGYKQSFFDSDTKNLHTVLELACNGDLANRIKEKKQRNQEFKENQIWTIGRDIVNGVAALHQRNIIHRDIKPANILFGDGDVAKLGDFNVSVKMTNYYVNSQIGTPFYASPEIWNNEPYSYQCDIWSLGCVLYQLCTLKKPFQGRTMDRMYRKVMTMKYSPIPYYYSYNLTNVIQRCLTSKDKRINAEDLKRIFQFNLTPLKNKVDNVRSCISLKRYGAHWYRVRKSGGNPEEDEMESMVQNSKPLLDRFLKKETKLPTYRSPLDLQTNRYHAPQHHQFASQRQIHPIFSPPKSQIIIQLESAQHQLLSKHYNPSSFYY